MFNHKLQGRTVFGNGKLRVVSNVDRRTVIGGDGRPRHKYICTVQCACGTTKEVQVDKLLSGNTVSCGCHKKAQHTHVTGKVFAEYREKVNHG